MKTLVVINGLANKDGRVVTALTLTLTFAPGMVLAAMAIMK